MTLTSITGGVLHEAATEPTSPDELLPYRFEQVERYNSLNIGRLPSMPANTPSTRMTPLRWGLKQRLRYEVTQKGRYRMNVSYDFSGEVAVITGAARGVGRAMVGSFVAAGCKVVAADRDEAGLLETCGPYQDAARPVSADVSSQDGVDAIVDAAVREFGKLSFCVNNAAVAPHTDLLDETARVWDTVYAVNCRGTFLMTQRAARVMIDQGHGGRIINFSSGAASRGTAGGAAYASSRAATESFTRVAAIELAPHAILVNCVSPGLIDTQPKPLAPAMAENLSRRIPALPLARPGQPEEVVSLVLWLCSDGASYITGTVCHVDGGSGVGSRPSGAVVDDDTRYDWVTGRR